MSSILSRSQCVKIIHLVRFALTDDTPQLILVGQPWGAFRELYREKWLNATRHTFHIGWRQFARPSRISKYTCAVPWQRGAATSRITLQSRHTRHPMARPWGRHMEQPLWIQTTSYRSEPRNNGTRPHTHAHAYSVWNLRFNHEGLPKHIEAQAKWPPR